MKKILLLSLALMSTTTVADNTAVTRLKSKSVQSHPSLGRVCLSHKDGQFTVFHEGRSKKVAREDSDPMLRNMNSRQLRAFLDNGKIRVNRYDNGDYKLNAFGTVDGGGPALASAAYWAVKGTGYALPFVWFAINFSEGNPQQPGAEQIGKEASKFASKKVAAVITRATTDVVNKQSAEVGTKLAGGVVKGLGTKTTGELIGSGVTSSGGYFAAVEAVAEAAYWAGLAVPGW